MLRHQSHMTALLVLLDMAQAAAAPRAKAALQEKQAQVREALAMNAQKASIAQAI